MTKKESEDIGPGLTPGAIEDLFDAHFPEARNQLGPLEIVSCGGGEAVVRLMFDARFVRPGGTISGPTMFQLADMTSYVAILAVLGEAAIDAVTTTLTINFLSRPRPEDLVCEVTTLRRGRRQAVCDARIYSAGARTLVAQASCIYALPMPKN